MKLIGVLLLIFLPALMVAAAVQAFTVRVSVASNGLPANGISRHPALSGDGRYVAFESLASNLVAGDTNNRLDVFVHDRQTAQTMRATDGNDHSRHPALSANGRYVAFESLASNLVAGDTNELQDVFVHDRDTEQTVRVTNGNGASGDAALSADGRYVAFESVASNLVGGDTNGLQDVFVHDRDTGQTVRVTNGNGASGDAALSGDGRYVAFESVASNLVGGDTNGLQDVFVHDRDTGQTVRVTNGNGASGDAALSADGWYVAFESVASNLVAGDTNGVQDVFVVDRDTGQTVRVTNGSGASGDASLSADGRYISFHSGAAALVTGDTNRMWDVFVLDWQSGQIARLSVSSSGAQGNRHSYGAALSADGQVVGFFSQAGTLVVSSAFNQSGVFVAANTLYTQLLPTPTPVFPPQNFFAVRTVTLAWARVADAFAYQIELSRSPAFDSTPAFAETVLGQTLEATTMPLSDGLYYWRVRACSSETVCGNWSTVQSFMVAG